MTGYLAWRPEVLTSDMAKLRKADRLFVDTKTGILVKPGVFSVAAEYSKTVLVQRESHAQIVGYF